jgi:CRP-like cAMP-binding protein
MYFIVSGKVEIETETRRLCLGPGAFFGEIALITAGPRTATAVAVMPSVLLVLDCGDFHSLAIQRPDLKNAIQEEADRRRAENVPLSIG